MNTKVVVHIVPEMAGPVDGIGQYAMNLACHLRSLHGVESQFIVCDPKWSGPGRLDGFIVQRLRMQNEAGMWSSLSSIKSKQAIVLLHYCSDAYHRAGLPFWLYRGVASWLKETHNQGLTGRRRLSVVFHDLWPTPAKPWIREFYRQMMQGWLIKQFHRRAVVSVVNTRRMQSELESIGPLKTFCFPAPSNWPQAHPVQRKGECSRRLRVVIFQHRGSCAPAVRCHRNLLSTLEGKKMLESVSLLGNGMISSRTVNQDLAFSGGSVPPERVQAQSDLTPVEVSKTLGGADFLLSHHLGEAACNSGVIMGALAGHCPVILPDGRNAHPLRENEHFIASDDSPESIGRVEQMCANGHLDRIAGAARLWYEQNADWAVTSEKYLEVLAATSSGLVGPISPSLEPPSVRVDASYRAPRYNY